jgi:hypothetical protein
MSIEIKPTDKALTRRLINQINRRLPELKSGKEYALEGIVGQEYWQDEDEDDSHHALGRAFSNLVGEGRAPFVDAGLTGDRHNNYQHTG